MRTFTTLPATADAHGWRIRRPAVARHAVGIAAALAVLASLGTELQSPGAGIKAELVAAAARLERMPMSAHPDSVGRSLMTSFGGNVVTIDPTGFPVRVDVTFRGLDRASCRDAVATARRLEGDVVVELASYASAADCRTDNDMTWRLMP